MNRSVDRRLARIEGQVKGVRRMVAEGEYCVDILNQIAAIRSAIQQVALEVSLGHVEHCVVKRDAQAHAKSETQSPAELTQELQQVLAKLVR